MKIGPMSKEFCETIRQWRNEDLSPWRTPYYLTKEMQEDFFDNLVSNRHSNNRFWAIIGEMNDVGNGVSFSKTSKFLGMGGLTTIQWENSNAEISLIIRPIFRNTGLGEKAVELILDQAFNYLNLKTVYGEVYMSNKASTFWKKIAQNHGAYTTILPARKYWQGRYWDSIYFSFDAAAGLKFSQ